MSFSFKLVESILDRYWRVSVKYPISEAPYSSNQPSSFHMLFNFVRIKLIPSDICLFVLSNLSQYKYKAHKAVIKWLPMFACFSIYLDMYSADFSKTKNSDDVKLSIFLHLSSANIKS